MERNTDVDFSRPGEDGALPPDFTPWQRGLTCTIGPELLSPVVPGRQYRLNATVRRIVREDASPRSYAALYERAAAIVASRIDELGNANAEAPLARWILAQGWFSHDLGSQRMDSASITMGIMLLQDGASPPPGERAPEKAALLSPSGGTPESFASKHLDDEGARRLDELHIEFDSWQATSDITLSYGEYVPACERADFPSIIRRAEQRTQRYRTSQSVADSESRSMHVLRREWWCVSTGKATNTSLAVVELSLRVQRPEVGNGHSIARNVRMVNLRGDASIMEG